MGTATPQSFGMQSFILYLGVAASAILLLSWSLAIVHRRDSALHARYMVGSALVLIDPALARLLIATVPGLGPLVPWVSYGVLFLILGVLLWRDRGRHGQRAFVVLTAVFALNFVLLNVVPRTASWAEFARWWGGVATA